MTQYVCVPSQSETQALLSDTAPPDFESLRLVLLKRVGGGHRLAPLQRAIHAFDLFMRSSSSLCSPRFDFFSDLLPHIHSWALDYPLPLHLPLLCSGTPARASLPRGTIRTLLSNAFFLNVLPFHDAVACDGDAPGRDVPTCDTPRFGDISFMRLYTSPRELGMERLLCLLAYFALAVHLQPHELNEEVCFERHVLPQSDIPNWSALSSRIDVHLINVHTERMENSNARCFMDFANKALHIHKIIASATQEEVLFSACPETFVGVLMSEVLDEREVIIIRNVRRFVEYEGYSSTFRFAGFYPGVRVHDIVAADATNTMHFTKSMLDRDLNKAYLGFSAAASASSSCSLPSSFSVTKVSTSHWGCGAFRGDQHFKFLQQVCASALAGVPLDYSTFGDAQTAASFKRLLGLIDLNNHTIASVYHAMSGFRKEKGTFLDYVIKNLSRRK